MGTKHTPAPWTWNKYFGGELQVKQGREIGIEPTQCLTNDGATAVMAGDRRVALVDLQANIKKRYWSTADDPERDANARLIAAAPELVEAHQSAIENITRALELGDRGDWRNAEIFLNNQRGISEAALEKAGA